MRCLDYATVSRFDVERVGLLDLGPLLCLVWAKDIKLDLRLI
jgi:hypothetical protein